MDTTSIVEIVIAVVVVYFFIKFIVSPVIKAILGVIIFLFLIYLLQRYLGFNLNQVLAPFGISFDPSRWGVSFNWLSGPIDYYINQIENFASHALQNVPKATIQNLNLNLNK